MKIRNLGIAILLAVLPAALLSVAADDKAPAGSKKIAAALQPFVEKQALAGAVVVVANKDKILDIEAVGYSDIEAKTLMGTDAVFWIASESKPITAAALMMLLDEGKLKLDDPVEKYLPEFKDLLVKEKDKELKKPSHAVTIREILTHTSGMPFASPQETPTLDKLTLREAALSYAKTPLIHEPGTVHQYSNAGINTAGRIIEVVSGMPYEELLEKRLLAPLDMKDTTFWPNEEQLKRLAKAYRLKKDKSGLEEAKIGQLKYPLNDRARQPMPAGGLFSTATDVAHFCQMVLGGGVYKNRRLLSEEAVKLMTSKQTDPTVKVAWGLGWSVGGGGTFGHGGAFATDMAIDPNRSLIFVWMVQHAGVPGDGGRSVFRRTAEELYKGAQKQP